MNDNSPPEPAAPDMQKLKSIFSQVTAEDFLRDEPPAELWTAIATAVDRPVNDVVILRRPHRRAWLGAAAVVLAGLAIAGWMLRSAGGSDNVVASAALTNEGLSPLGAESSGKAEIIRRGGSYRLHLDLSRVPNEPASYVEVWLIDSQVKGMISLGPFHGDGDYAIPSGVDPAKYPIVDVSIEPADGVPTHSGVSIVRGVAAA
ncbi:MAG TPA: anti-sigma factor [Ilumatobacteraceae bacterium]|nr:anti-sigma factor [Ilumatobacteraceae bacterium]